MWKKRIIIIIAAILLLVLCVPVRGELDDGGSIIYRAVIYSVEDCHALWINREGSWGYTPEFEEGAEGYMTGLQVSVFGIVVFDNTKFEQKAWSSP
ncbi:MAG: hypothetical protein FWF10_10000 [Clostridiales bacterium]|nr:hypothetical protein [Clostridiales bacterium]